MTKVKNDKYLGYRAEDLTLPFAAFFDEQLKDAKSNLTHALEVLAPNLPPLEEVTSLAEEGYAEVETGLYPAPDGSMHIAVLTPMPGVSPQMWDWWFAWHGCQDSRYKLWHPGAHVSAAWQDGDQEQMAYIGRTSMIEEYIGKRLEKANIHFVAPASLGLQNSADCVYICARIGYTQYPLNFGWLVHQVRSTGDGAEMRSRFWLGGPHIQLRSQASWAKILSTVLQKTIRLPLGQGKALLQHCAEEMRHLAAFLPQLYQQFNQKV